jgi:hypothetical protein
MRIILIISLLPVMVSGQNLVPNGSFEVLDSCPAAVNSCDVIEFATGWFEPINCGTDLFHACAFPEGCFTPTTTGVSPFDGDGMAALALLSASEFSPNRREYASCALASPLIADSAYIFSINIKHAGNDIVSVGSIGVYFSLDSATDYSLDHQLIGHTPQLQRDPDSLMSNTDIWYLWEDTLIAEGGEQFIMIGNFLDDENTPYFQPSFNPGSAYYIDDVRLEKISKPNSVKELDVRFGVSPNPSNGLVSIEYKGNLTPMAMTLLTVEGRQVFSEPWHRQLDVSSLSEGIYLLRVEFENGAVGTQRLVVKR